MELFLNDVRLAYPNLFVPRDYKGDKKYKYSATFLIEKTRAELIAKIEAAIKTAAQEEWGAKYEAILRSIRSQKGQFNFRDGEEKADKAGFSGCMFISAKNDAQPLIIDRLRNPLTEADRRPYAGCYVNAKIRLYAYENSGKGITAALTGVQFLRDGDALGATSVASLDDFEDLTVGANVEDFA